jgi:lipoprotein-releasing system permease protein
MLGPMYHLLLVRKYLVSKIMPLLAACAVALCVALVLVTWSVMGGFLNNLLKTGRTTTGDITIAWPTVGFAHYDELAKQLEADPQIAAAAPVVESYGLLSLPNNSTSMVYIRGIAPESYGRVTAFNDILWWKPLDKPLAGDNGGFDPRVNPILRDDLAAYFANGKLMRRLTASGQHEPAIVMGIDVSGFNAYERGGYYTPRVVRSKSAGGEVTDLDVFLPRDGRVVVSVLPIDRQGRVLEQAPRKLAVANEFASGVYEVDSRVVLLPLETLQEMLRMRGGKRVVKSTIPAAGPAGDDEFAGASAGGEMLVDEPPRITHLLVRGKADLSTLGSANGLKKRVVEIYADFAAAHVGDVPAVEDITILTWEDQNRTMISAVQKETGVVLFLFSFISMVAVVLIMAIFWSMISEKTKDIGVLRAIGASQSGIAGVWLAYGAAIGLVGATLGWLLATAIVRNINEIHDWMGSALGIVIWSPEIYQFTRIPTALDANKILIVASGALIASLIGALVPAWRAASMNPVKALRFE